LYKTKHRKALREAERHSRIHQTELLPTIFSSITFLGEENKEEHITSIKIIQNPPEKRAFFDVYQATEIQSYDQAFQDVEVQGPVCRLYWLP